MPGIDRLWRPGCGNPQHIEKTLPLIPDIPTTVIPGGNIYTVDVCTEAWCAAVGDFCLAAFS